MSATFNIGDEVRATEPIYIGDTPSEDADPYEEGWVHARSGSSGRIIGKSGNEWTVYFNVSETAANVEEEKIESRG